MTCFFLFQKKIDFIYTSGNTNPDLKMAENQLGEIARLRAELSTLKKQMTAVQQRIKQMEQEVYDNCNHVWTIDRTNVGEHTEHVCVHCNMSKTL